MNRMLIYFILGFLCTLLQASLFSQLVPLDLKPDLLLILVIYLAMNESGARAALTAYGLGCLFDVFAGTTMGLFGLALLITYLLARAAAIRLNTESSPLLLILVVVCTVLYSGALVFLSGFFAADGAFATLVLRRLPLQLVLNLGSALVLLGAAAAVQRRHPRLRIPSLSRLGRSHEP